MDTLITIFIVLAGVASVVGRLTCRYVRQGQRGVIVRSGVVRPGVRQPGWVFLAPWAERMAKVDLGVRCAYAPTLEFETIDDTAIIVTHLSVEYRVVNPAMVVWRHLSRHTESLQKRLPDYCDKDAVLMATLGLQNAIRTRTAAQLPQDQAGLGTLAAEWIAAATCDNKHAVDYRSSTSDLLLAQTAKIVARAREMLNMPPPEPKPDADARWADPGHAERFWRDYLEEIRLESAAEAVHPNCGIKILRVVACSGS